MAVRPRHRLDLRAADSDLGAGDDLPSLALGLSPLLLSQLALGLTASARIVALQRAIHPRRALRQGDITREEYLQKKQDLGG
jgi:DNA-binding transcriptional regulator YdaS (Cro superfamily)